MRALPGIPHQLGATWDGEGTNFAVFSEHADAVDLCLFARAGDGVETTRIRLPERVDSIWHGYVAGVGPGQCYGFRVHGTYAPEQGHRFNAAKLLLDPYARAISGPIGGGETLLGYRTPAAGADEAPDDRDDAGDMPKCVVVDPAFEWGDDRRPNTAWNRTVIYECHVKGMTMRHPEVAAPLRGTYTALASDPILAHLKSLGVTAVELMPVHHSGTEPRLARRNLTNYWGYNTAGFFAPDARFATAGIGQQVHEFRSMVRRFHQAGIEVILDVVFNHTAEGDHLGPTLSFRGIDNASYYRLQPGNRSRYVDWTGCGNTLNVEHPRAMRLVLDSLRYWVVDMHVDGFRFDLAVALAREGNRFHREVRFFDLIRRDPTLSQVKLIAEPWDVGEDGYQPGNFPAGWAEWNGKYRDSVRRFWRGDQGQIPDLAYRLAGSSDVFEGSGRSPQASINFVTSHDGYTLRDLVTYERKHNETNGESNRDGTDDNFSGNWGIEGPTTHQEIATVRERTMRNLIATLAFSQGVPMLSHGDELGRTQLGNNNAYCHDSELTWIDWTDDAASRRLLEWTRKVLMLRDTHPVFRRRAFFSGQSIGPGAKDVAWFRPDGLEMLDLDWSASSNHTLGMLINGAASEATSMRGGAMVDDSLLLLVNAGDRARRFVLPALTERGTWVEELNTVRDGARRVRTAAINVAAHSLVLLRYVSEGASEVSN